jgi:hypothetical protein
MHRLTIVFKGICMLGLCSLSLSCVNYKNWTVPPELIGNWKTTKHKITVRTEPKWMKFEFVSDSAIVTLQIQENKIVSGTIGSAIFKNGTIELNAGNPDFTGISYILKCGNTTTRFFDSDPLASKEIEIWLSPIKGRTMDAEIRYTENGAKFPMASVVFIKQHE